MIEEMLRLFEVLPTDFFDRECGRRVSAVMHRKDTARGAENS